MAIYINNNGTAKRMDGAGDGSLYAPVTSVATPENGDTASKTYAVGEMFIRGGKLCTCLVAIAQDGTFVKDTNYKEGDVGSVLTELNSNKSKVLLYTGYATFHDAWNLRKTFDVQPGYLGAVCNQGSLVPKTGSYQLASEAIGDSQISVTLFAQDAPFQSGDSVLVCIMVLYP